MKQHFSKRVAGAKRSAIRELLKLTEQPDIISLGGGLPAPESFPNKELATIAYDELMNNSANVLQYGTTEGSRTLRDVFLQWLEPQNIHATREQLLVTTASQQGLDLLCKAFFAIAKRASLPASITSDTFFCLFFPKRNFSSVI